MQRSELYPRRVADLRPNDPDAQTDLSSNNVAERTDYLHKQFDEFTTWVFDLTLLNISNHWVTF